MLLSFKVRVSANERESSKLSFKKTARYWPQQKIYLMSRGSASTDSSNSFPTLLWEPLRQKYLAFLTGCLSEARCGSTGLLSLTRLGFLGSRLGTASRRGGSGVDAGSGPLWPPAAEGCVHLGKKPTCVRPPGEIMALIEWRE